MIVRISKWDDSLGIIHTSTDWELSTTADFSNVIASEYDSTEYLNAWVNLFSVPIGVTYYYRYRRKLTSGGIVTYTDWVNAVPITGKAEDISLLFPDDVHIEHPTIYVSKEDILNPELDTFTITSSEYRGTADGHAYTHYIITDENDRVIYHSLYNTTDKLSIVIDKTKTPILDAKTITITVIHGSGSNIESKPGYEVVNIELTNHILKSNIRKVMPFTDFPLVFDKKDTRLPFNICRVEVYSSVHTEPVDIKVLPTPESNISVIPGCVLEPNSTYIVKVYSTRLSYADTVTKYTLNTISNDVIKPIDISYMYNKSIDIDYQEVNISLLPGITTAEVYSGNIPMVLTNDERVYIFRYDRSTRRLVNTKIVLNGISIPNTKQSNILIKQLNPHKLLVDMLTKDNKPMFVVYDIVPELNTYTIVNTKIRDNEVDCLGKTNGYIQISTNEILYLPTNSNMLMKYNIDTNDLTKIGPVPITNLLNGTMFRIRGNRILILGGDSTKGIVYNLNDGTYIDAINIPVDFRNKTLKANTLSNGDTVITRIVSNPELENTNEYLYFSIQDTSLTTLAPVYKGKAFPNISVSLASGEVLLGNNIGNATDIYIVS
jgi:hypothetical protein